MKRILITGGIGCGKSVVARIVEAMGYPVYDCDARARQIMESDPVVKAKLASAFPDCMGADGNIDRKLLAACVFRSPERLDMLNSIVHQSVRDDLTVWFETRSHLTDIAFVETAIPVTSRIDAMVDEIWLVTAPMNIREQRVTSKRGMNRKDFQRRVEAQCTERLTAEVKKISNDGTRPLLPRIESLLTQ